jgi:ABC-type microcin C transport system permease subunit YejE
LNEILGSRSGEVDPEETLDRIRILFALYLLICSFIKGAGEGSIVEAMGKRLDFIQQRELESLESRMHF